MRHRIDRLPFERLPQANAARELRRSLTPAERYAWSLLRRRGIHGLKFRRQHVLGRFVADFYCPARRLVLEVISKNQPGIRLAQKFGFEFCGYNDQYYPNQDVALFFGRALK